MRILYATVRTYKRGVDEEERWQCPSCGFKQSANSPQLFAALDSNKQYFEECCNCGTPIQLSFRRMFRKNY